MTAIDRDRARAAFKSYTDAYDATNTHRAQNRAYVHVAEACGAVAREQGWSSEDIDLAWLCGLLHDMGRFEQLRRWDTFKDAESMSHAALGIEVLFGENPADAPAVTSIRDLSMTRQKMSSSERALPITAISVYPRSSTSARGASAISCAMATRSTLCAPSPTALSTLSSRWTRRRFSAAVSRRRHLPPLTSTAASHAMSAMSPPTSWWGLSALCLSSSIQQAARCARTGRYPPPARRALWHYAALYRPRHAGNLEPPKGRDARLAGARLALKLGQQLLDDLDASPTTLYWAAPKMGHPGPR